MLNLIFKHLMILSSYRTKLNTTCRRLVFFELHCVIAFSHRITHSLQLTEQLDDRQFSCIPKAIKDEV